MIDLSVIVPSYETAALLADCLESLAAAQRANPHLALEVIVVDNGSRDESVEVARRAAISPWVIALVENRGFAAAVNRGLRICRGRCVLLLNSDVTLSSDALGRALSLFDEEPDVGIVGAALRHPDGRRQRSVHALPGWQSELLPEAWVRPWRTCRAAQAARPAERSEAFVQAGGQDVEAVRGAVFFLRRSLVEVLGPFDEDYFFFLEETDYCQRARAAGYRVVHAEAIHAVHRLGASSKRRAGLATRIEFHRSLYRYLRRHRGGALVVLARVLRTLRSVVGLVGLLPGALFGPGTRARLFERWGLVLWHLRGCPPTPTLAEALRSLPAPTGSWPEAAKGNGLESSAGERS